MSLKEFISEFKWYFARKKLKDIKLVIFDLDGVMTDGFLYIDVNGFQTKRFNVKDGLGIRILQSCNLKVAIISGGKSGCAEQRAKDLDINLSFFEVKDKEKCVKKIQKILNIEKENTLYLGDDLNDLTVKNSVNLLISTNDASNSYKRRCDLILKSDGGKNAVRELSERIVKDYEEYKKIIKNGFIQTN